MLKFVIAVWMYSYASTKEEGIGLRPRSEFTDFAKPAGIKEVEPRDIAESLQHRQGAT